MNSASSLPLLLQLQRKLADDCRLSTWHNSLYLSALFLWQEHGASNVVRISRKELMSASKIFSATTYHKCIRELCEFGYIKYTPTYNSYAGSTIEIIIP